MIRIVDFGMGNLGSIVNMLRKIGAKACEVTSDLDRIAQADKLILPGVGNFRRGMTNLRERGLIEPLQHAAMARGVPILGICLGMQMLTRSSEEGHEKGLGWIPADTRRFNFVAHGCDPLPVPHMGWNVLRQGADSRLLSDWGEETRFYFVHSYHVICDAAENSTAEAVYGYPFTVAIEQGNVFGVQFHPEKSHRFGMRLLSRFVEL